jgi:hypothetical protein
MLQFVKYKQTQWFRKGNLLGFSGGKKLSRKCYNEKTNSKTIIVIQIIIVNLRKEIK